MMDAFYNPVRTFCGRGSLTKLPELVSALGAKRILVIEWSDKVQSLETFSKIAGNTDLVTRFETFTASNPTVEQLFEVLSSTSEFRPDLIVGVGGGSVMDVAKSLCALYGSACENADALSSAIAGKSFTKRKIPWIGVPTTAGTGSEVTCWATVWDPEHDRKLSVEDHSNYAYAALVDADLSCTLPLGLAVSSALDALCHAVEAYWSKSRNLVSRALALEAVRIVTSNMDSLIEGDMKAHDAMARASMLAGLSFSNTHTTACHSVSYPLTMRYRIPHGVAVAMLLAPVLELNMASFDGMDPLMRALNCSTAMELGRKIKDVMKRSGIKSSLREWGASMRDFDDIAPLCLTKGRADNNPAPLTHENIIGILQKAF